MFRLGTIATGGKLIRWAICPLRKGFWLDGCLGVEPRGVRSLFQKASATWGGGASMIGRGGPFPFSVIPWHLPYN
jgi:hypothetical protein